MKILFVLLIGLCTTAQATTVTIGQRAADTFSGFEDTAIDSANATTNYSTETFYQINSVIPAKLLMRATGLSNITGPVTVSSAKLYCYPTSAFGTIGAYAARRAWVATQATWNIYSTGNNWGTAGAGNTSSDIYSPATGTVSAANGYVYMDVTADVQAMINGSLTNNGWLIDVSAASYGYIWLSEGADVVKPYLEVVYTATGGATPTGRMSLLGVGR